MKHSWVGLIELFVTLLFVAGWGVLELIILWMDRRQARAAGARGSERDARHAEGQ
jgi:uncharacterized membrane protein YsdA (DUF1294 family)